ncbi:MAG TPA: CHASE2 domain-containing protein [Usitatibacter sp.]|nr:CHASE2 domain-containing protein [Usitatibacter sp.]
MLEPGDGGRVTTRAFAIAAIALAGFAFSLTPPVAWLDNKLLDLQWRLLAKFAPRAVPDDIIIVGIDPATVNAIPVPPGLWHEPLGKLLQRIAAAKPRAIGLDYPLPERSYDELHAGLDRALMLGLAAAAQNGPFVATLNIDPRTRSARRIHAPFLALLGDARLGIGLAARDDDGVTRRYSLLIPTEDGGYPTLAGRLCRELAAKCNEGLIDFSLAPPLRYVSMYDVLRAEDLDVLKRLFRDRIVFIGETQPFSDRIEVPVNVAGWEPSRGDSPGVAVHAQTLRTALMGHAAQEALRPLTALLVLLAAAPFLAHRPALGLAVAAVGALALLAGAMAALRGGLYVPVGAPLVTLGVAWAALAAPRRRGSRNIQHSD